VTQLLYVIDEIFTEQLTGGTGPDERTCGDFRMVMCSDRDASAPPLSDFEKRPPVAWSDRVKDVADKVCETKPDVAIVVGHKVIFRFVTEFVEKHKADARIPSAERELMSRVTGTSPGVIVAGFHHERGISRIWDLLHDPGAIHAPGLFRRLRAIVEDGGGPFGDRKSVV